MYFILLCDCRKRQYEKSAYMVSYHGQSDIQKTSSVHSVHSSSTEENIAGIISLLDKNIEHA